MKEYTFTEKRIEGYYRDIETKDEIEYETYEVEISIDNLSREDVDKLREIIREIVKNDETTGG